MFIDQRSNEATDEQVWVTSSYSTAEGPQCVEVHRSPATIRVRDSTDRHGPQLAFTPTAWTAFLAFVAEDQPKAT